MAEGDAVKGKHADLPVRIASAIVMLVIAGGALWLDGWFWQLFVGLVALLTLAEYLRLLWRATSKLHFRIFGAIAGAGYIGFATFFLANNLFAVPLIVGLVVAVDVFAYFSGRTFGGPKIAPKISPSKTWAGLIGGAIGAALFFVFYFQVWPSTICPVILSLGEQNPYAFDHRCEYAPLPFDLVSILQILFIGFIVAAIAQSGDFFESWLKRKAGMKDSSQLIPGHGGVFDRVDGLIAVAFLAGILSLVP